jgi:hypothetical protein
MAGMRGIIGRDRPFNYQMGLGHDQPVTEYFPGTEFPGRMGKFFHTESNHRAFYTRWRDLMSGLDWPALQAKVPATHPAGDER